MLTLHHLIECTFKCSEPSMQYRTRKAVDVGMLLQDTKEAMIYIDNKHELIKFTNHYQINH